MVTKLLISLIVFASLLNPVVAERLPAQQEPWLAIAPRGRTFSVMMPTPATETHRLIPASPISPRVALYQCVSKGKRYVIGEFQKTRSDVVLVFSSSEHFIAGMEESFKSDGIPKSITFDRDVTDDTTKGRQYRITLGKYPGVARFLATQSSFYALIVIGADESDRDVARFLSSLRIGEVSRNAEATGINRPLIVGTGSLKPPSQIPELLKGDEGPPEPWPLPVAPISGGILNGKAVSLGRPEYPDAARRNGDSGKVRVQIIIDEFGDVISAEALDGPATLREAAVAAAWKSRFTPTRLQGQPVWVSGVIVFNFVYL
jgi:TonB family protein